MNDKDSDILEYLKFFYKSADFGPAHGDVVMSINEMFEEKFKKKVPESYKYE